MMLSICLRTPLQLNQGAKSRSVSFTGAENLENSGDSFEIYTPFEDFETVRSALESADIDTRTAELTMIPQNSVKVEGRKAEQMLKLMEALEDHDDVQHVYANFDIEESEMEALLQGS